MTEGVAGIECGLTSRLLEFGKALTELAYDLAALSATKTASEPDVRSAFNFNDKYFEEPIDGNQDLRSTTSRREARPPMPDPRLIRRIIKLRQKRLRHFDASLFADPAWDMLLDLSAAREEHTRVSVTSLCIASGVPPTTALRWIGQMIDSGLLIRTEDSLDKRRAFMTLTDRAADAIARYFADISDEGLQVL